METPSQVMKQLHEAADFIKASLGDYPVPAFGLILGTGLGGLVEQMKVHLTIPFSDIPHFPQSSIKGHAGQLVMGSFAGKSVLVMRGRVHVYEGIPLEQIVFPVRLMRILGVGILVITNAAGGLDPSFAPGDIMAITDHINLMGRNPLIGPNLDELGIRFPDMTQVYDRELLALAEQSALESQIRMHKGVYIGVTGPSMETPAETRMLRILGADAVGMSTIPEVITAVHCGLRVLVMSAITNVNRPDCMEPAPLDTILANASVSGIKIFRVLEGVLRQLPQD
jgi:purine-nucleoside phosphorylase